MAVEIDFESLDQLSMSKGQTVDVGWELFPAALVSVIDYFVYLGFDSARHIVRVSTVDHEGDDPGGSSLSSFYYSVTNVSAGPALVVTSRRTSSSKLLEWYESTNSAR
jgi:hypothetical protein